jgi:hypothetical protein
VCLRGSLEFGAGTPWPATGAMSMSLDVDDELIQAPLNDVKKNVRDASGIDNFRKNAQLIFPSTLIRNCGSQNGFMELSTLVAMSILP